LAGSPRIRRVPPVFTIPELAVSKMTSTPATTVSVPPEAIVTRPVTETGLSAVVQVTCVVTVWSETVRACGEATRLNRIVKTTARLRNDLPSFLLYLDLPPFVVRAGEGRQRCHHDAP
jgi:hypothetical protein